MQKVFAAGKFLIKYQQMFNLTVVIKVGTG